MTNEGRFETVTERLPGERFAEDLIRYSPRQISLQPRESQTIRLLLRKPSDLPPGEYRSHLFMRGLPPENFGEDIEAVAGDGAQIQVQLIPIFGISIPIIVRHGDLSAGASISSVSLDRTEPTSPIISFDIHRDGGRSLYGDVSITHRQGTKEVDLTQRLGIAVYTPNDSRHMTMRLELPDDVDLMDYSIHVAYRERPEQDGAALAEAELPLP